MKFTTLPNLANSFAKMKLILDLQTKVTGNDCISTAVQYGFASKTPPNEILSFLKSQATDCPATMEKAIGKDLTKRILTYA